MKPLLPLLLALAAVLVVGADAASVRVEPDVTATISQLVTEKGYTFEVHHVMTKDGCDLSVFRVRDPAFASKKLPAVLLQHGILDSADAWVLNSAWESLAFIAASAGYDVFLGNSRGNKYSTGRTQYSPNSHEYWDWTWDQMAFFDIPAVVDAILQVTGQPSLGLVCHSQGCTQTIGMLSRDGFNGTELMAPKINALAALAPVCFLAHCKSLLVRGAADIGADQLLKILGVDQFLPNSTFLSDLLPAFCSLAPPICDSVIWMIAGDTQQHLNKTRLPVYMSHFPSGTSTIDVCHWAQTVRQKDYAMYDYGESGNMRAYGQKTPPQYDLSRFPTSVKLGIFTGALDDLADVKDVATLLANLPPTAITMHQQFSSYGHLDFTWGDSAYVDVYPQVLALLNMGKP